MRFFVKPIDGPESDRQIPGGLARVDDDGQVQLFSGLVAAWVPAFESEQAEIAARTGWSPVADADADAVARALIASPPAGTPGADHRVSLRLNEHPTDVRPHRFDEVVQLSCIQSPDKTLRRFIPLLIVFGICVLILAGLVISLLVHGNLELARRWR